MRLRRRRGCPARLRTTSAARSRRHDCRACSRRSCPARLRLSTARSRRHGRRARSSARPHCRCSRCHGRLRSCHVAARCHGCLRGCHVAAVWRIASACAVIAAYRRAGGDSPGCRIFRVRCPASHSGLLLHPRGSKQGGRWNAGRRTGSGLMTFAHKCACTLASLPCLVRVELGPTKEVTDLPPCDLSPSLSRRATTCARTRGSPRTATW
jgi:hypothetical protein